MSAKAIVYIDGENFLHRVEDTLKAQQQIRRKEEIVRLGVRPMIEALLPEYSDIEIRYYGTKIRTYDIADEAVKERARTMVESQRRLKRCLENQRISFVTAGSLRVRETTCSNCNETSLVFKEKGVDVRCAIDLVEDANEHTTQVILSSDSDILPALRVAHTKGSRLIYVHHAEQPNYAMMKSAHETRVFTPSQILTAYTEGE